MERLKRGEGEGRKRLQTNPWILNVDEVLRHTFSEALLLADLLLAK